MKDEDLMPWGIHKGKPMADVPDHYLLWLWDTNKCSGQVKMYIKQNLDAIKKNLNRHKDDKPD